MKALQAVLEDIGTHVGGLDAGGAVATYIPALARIDPDRFGIAVSGLDGEFASTGDHDVPFSIQSISKVFSLTLCMAHLGDALWSRFGREPSGDPFNSLVQLEHESGVPRNPFINAGAIVMADCLVDQCADPVAELVDLVSRLAGVPILVDDEVARSESETGFRNRSLAHLMKSFGNIRNDVDEVLEVYFSSCALAMTCDQLARSVGFLANGGVDPATGDAIVTPLQARRINALMLTCGTYDEAGEFAFAVGIPCKSGVGGGIVGVVPDVLTTCVWSPALDPTGNSLAGRVALEHFVERTGHTVF